MNARSVVNAAALGVVLWLNGLAGSGALSGESIGVIANRYPSTFLPQNYVFGIWSLIYLGLLAAVLYQLVPRQDSDTAFGRIGWWWLLSCVLNVGWVVTFAFSSFGTAMLVMVALLAVLAVIYDRIGRGKHPLAAGERAFVAFPFSLYLSWILVAVIANSFQYVTYLGWEGPGSAMIWSPVMMVAATVVAIGMVFRCGDWVFPCVTGWAFAGIADRYDDVAVIASTAQLCVAAGFLGLAAAVVYRRRRGSAGVPSRP